MLKKLFSKIFHRGSEYSTTIKLNQTNRNYKPLANPTYVKNIVASLVNFIEIADFVNQWDCKPNILDRVGIIEQVGLPLSSVYRYRISFDSGYGKVEVLFHRDCDDEDFGVEYKGANGEILFTIDSHTQEVRYDQNKHTLRECHLALSELLEYLAPITDYFKM